MADQGNLSNLRAERFQQIIGWIIICTFVLLTVLAITVLMNADLHNEFGKLITEHFRAIVGLPSGAAASLFIVMLLKQTQGPLEFEGLGFKFRGASGPVVLWALCYLAITGSIWLLW